MGREEPGEYACETAWPRWVLLNPDWCGDVAAFLDEDEDVDPYWDEWMDEAYPCDEDKPLVMPWELFPDRFVDPKTWCLAEMESPSGHAAADELPEPWVWEDGAHASRPARDRLTEGDGAGFHERVFVDFDGEIVVHDGRGQSVNHYAPVAVIMAVLRRAGLTPRA